ncbi:MAG: SgcJ/EcaC family oxidoreductase [Anaerolineales bacterium]|jgi:uncharacterized protein (TIGR02246 family)
MEDPREELLSLLKAYEDAWNTHEAGSVAAFFSLDADMVIGNHPKATGRNAIEASWAAYFSKIDEARKAEFELESSRMVTPEVAIIDVSSTTSGAAHSGDELPTRLARGTWVLVRDRGQWRIIALRALPAVGDKRVASGTDR